MSWSNKYKRSINCDSPKGFSQRAHCAARRKRAKGENTKSRSPFNEMHQVKSHRSIEQIAKKHRLEVSFVKHQLEMGIPIEHEHTKDKDLATDIALQHLDEIPDYYTRLKKMEASAKREHKKFKDISEEKMGLWENIRAKRKRGEKPAKPGEKGYPKTLDIEEGLKQARKNVGASKCWPGKVAKGTKIKNGIEVPDCKPIKKSIKEDAENTSDGVDDMDNPLQIHFHDGVIRYCPMCQKNEKASECKYGEKYWKMFSHPINIAPDKKYTPNTPHPGNFPESYDHEYSMARSELSTIISAAKRLKKKIGKGEGNLEAWVQSKITKAADYIDTAADYVDSGEMKEETAVAKKPKKPLTQQQIRSKTEQLYKLMLAAKAGPKTSDVAKESVSIEDAHGNHYVEFIDIIKPEPLKASKGIGSRMLGEAKSFTNFMTEAKKSEMKCNSPKAEPVGNSLTGKSHVVKACKNGKEKLIRFGQRGVKGSPKKEGESKAYASRRHKFQTRHAKNIAKGKMSAAYWANKVKW
jgi:hypothetical protein